MISLNVYDFDNTIYAGDSTAHFYFFCLKRHPYIMKFVPETFWHFLKHYVFKAESKTDFKEKMYKFLTMINLSKDLEDFWLIHKKNIKGWYILNKKSNDVIISASPLFLLKPICGELKIKHLIASNVNPETGKYEGLNCHGEEKVKRYRKAFSGTEIQNFYSDSCSDTPLAQIAQNAFIVKGDKILKWPDI